LLRQFDDGRGVLDYVPFEVSTPPTRQGHQKFAVEALRVLDRACELWAYRQGIPKEQFFRVRLAHTTPSGVPVSFSDFWGTDDVVPGENAPPTWCVPARDGYKPAFFHPPYGLGLSHEVSLPLFEAINRELFGDDLSRPDLQVYSWATDWSNYFDAGHEWWGAFLWTVYSPATGLVTAIGASSTD
jgi:hypothetical protein